MSARELYKLLHDEGEKGSLDFIDDKSNPSLTARILVTEANIELISNLSNDNYFTTHDNIETGSILSIKRTVQEARDMGVYFTTRHALASSYNAVPSAIDENDFYIADINYDSKIDATEPDVVKSILNILKIEKALSLLSNFQKKKELIFVNQSTMTVNTKFDANKLTNDLIEYTSSEEIESAIEVLFAWSDPEFDKSHLQQKKTVFSSQLFTLLKLDSANDNFLTILYNFEKLVSDSVSSYQLYMEDFSFSRFEKKLEERSVDYYGKITKAVLDVRNQILGLPIAFVFINIIRNNLTEINPFLIVIPLFFYCLILLIILNQQKQYLNDLEADSNEFIIQNVKSSGLKKTLEDKEKILHEKINSQRKIISWFQYFVYFFMAYALFMAFSWEDLVKYYNYLTVIKENLIIFLDNMLLVFNLLKSL